ncbi:calcium-binding EGF-like domain-containing protein [Labilithrix luteola]|uniref:calcium-binding EGF-like domain-containing protein n=1 Tax=Labilithrix luteola TaxID=1391654 RepID=UPI0011BA8DAE|nr:calcium-binding EGF-like domain-containing protein [Labilithrix luteola]
MRKLVASVLVPSLASLVLLACSDAAESSDPAQEQSGEAGVSTPDAGAGKDGGQVDGGQVDSGKSDAGKSDSGVDAGPSCASDNGGCDPNATCEVAAGKVVCTCKTGYEGDGETCADVDECAKDNGGCLENATCANTVGGRTCTCNPGYSGDGVLACTDIDECATNGGLGDCNANATCANTVGGRTCTCNAGYLGDGLLACIDIDECAKDNGGCNEHATCTNIPGSRTCACTAEYVGTGVGDDCVPVTTTFAVDTNLSTTNTGNHVCADGGDMVSYSVTALTATSATLASTASAGCLKVGDQVLLINLQGTSTASANVGNYETLYVTAITGDVVTFKSKSKFYGATTGQDDGIGVGTGAQRVVLQRIPLYRNVVVEANATLTANGWDGLKGGIFAMSALGNVTVNGTIDMSSKGYRGGVRTTIESTTGQQGESVFGLGANSERARNGGGGGGSGDSQGCGIPFGVGGAGGGYGTAGTATYDGCAYPGATYGTADLSKLFFGAGGGAGGTDNTFGDNPYGGYGGNGGGIVFIQTAGAATGSLRSTGGNGEGDAPGVECMGTSTVDCWDYSGPGGAGAGGSILVSAVSFSGTTNVSGGAGGNGTDGLAGNGGNGGNGRVKKP